MFQVAFYAIRQRDGLSLFYSSRASRKGHNTLRPSCTWLLRDAMLFEWRMPWIAVGFSVHRKRNACRIGMRCIIRSVQCLPCRQGKEGICARRQREPTWGTCRRTVLHRNELTAWRCGTWHLPRSVTLGRTTLRYLFRRRRSLQAKATSYILVGVLCLFFLLMRLLSNCWADFTKSSPKYVFAVLFVKVVPTPSRGIGESLTGCNYNTPEPSEVERCQFRFSFRLRAS